MGVRSPAAAVQAGVRAAARARSPDPRPVVVDAMGGDHAPAAVVEGAVQAHASGIPVLLVGDEAVIRPMLPDHGPVPEVVHATEVVGMDDRPSAARTRDDASVRVAARCVAEGRGRAMVSCGNSGGTLVAAVLELGKVDGIDRPAIATSLPRLDGGTLYLIDVGTTADAQPQHLVSFARLGEAWARTEGVARPRIGLLSNGAEPSKGNRLVRDAHPRLAALDLDYIGHVEPTAAFSGACDVLVCDGFTGNILLKTAEAVIGMLRAHATRRIQASLAGRIGAWWMRPALRGLRDDVDWRARGGAVLLGVPATVVIAHGRSDAAAVRAAIGLAHYADDARLVDAVRTALAAALPAPGSGSDTGQTGAPAT